MSLTFVNQHYSSIWAMVEWYRPNCPDGGDWIKKGWWKIDAGQSAVVYGGDVREVNQYWYCYAHSIDGYQWPGTDGFPELVPINAFEWCNQVADTTSRQVFMDQFSVGLPNHVHTFLGP
ncbi:DUF1036 domain-containing protein [Streptomyces sp. NPDC020883]|uniref:DUF1036 domain-containing protein n=1 Tax=unclassified Streptomyces TaxID=2593676 RepID=UPI0034E2ADAB